MSDSPAGPVRPFSRPTRRMALSIAAVAAVACAVASAVLVGGAPALSAQSLWPWPAPLEDATRWQQQHPWTFGLGFFLVFTAMAAVPLPGCSVLALAAGAWWGWAGGAVIVTGASTAGATLAFLAARHAARDAVQHRWGHRLQRLEHLLERHGGLLVFWLRLAPVIPYPVLNPLLGLTRLSTARFLAASAAGMLAGSALYTWVGAKLGAAAGWHDLLTPPVLAAVLALAALPLAMRAAVRRVAPALSAEVHPAPFAGAPAARAANGLEPGR